MMKQMILALLLAVNVILALLLLAVNASAGTVHHPLTSVPRGLPYSFASMHIPSAIVLMSFKQVNPEWRYDLNDNPIHVIVQDTIGLAIVAPKRLFDVSDHKQAAIAFIPVAAIVDTNYSIRVDEETATIIDNVLKEPSNIDVMFDFIRKMVNRRRGR